VWEYFRGGRRLGVTGPLQVMQTVQAEIGLWVQASVGHDSGDHVEVEGVIGQVQFEEALGRVRGVRQWPRLWIVRPPDGIESGPSPAPARNASGPRFNAVVIGPCWNRGGTYGPASLNGHFGREDSSLIFNSPELN